MKQSAGILLYKVVDDQPQFFLVHPGGPFWKNKDVGAWSIPKGEFDDDEDPLEAAIREFEEETGMQPAGPFEMLHPVRLKSGKIVHGWACKGDVDPEGIISNTIAIEWPPKTGKTLIIPEVDKAAWFGTDEALLKINPAQAAFIAECKQRLAE